MAVKTKPKHEENNDVESTQPAMALVPVERTMSFHGWSAVRNLAEAVQLANIVGTANALPDVRNAAVALLKILAGGELGFGPFASLVDVHMIEGKPSIGAHLRAASIKGSAKYDYDVVEADEQGTVCELAFFERVSLTGGETRKFVPGWKRVGTIRLTYEEAQRRGMTVGKGGVIKANWKNAADDMLFARCISKGYRRHCPDLTGGVLTYDPDELDSADSFTTALPAPAPAPVPGLVVHQQQRQDVAQDAEVIDPASPSMPPPVETATEHQVERIGELIAELGFTEDQWKKAYASRGVSAAWELTREQATSMIHSLENVRHARKALGTTGQSG